MGKQKRHSFSLSQCHLDRHALPPRLTHITLSPVCAHTPPLWARTATAPCRFAALVHAFVWRCAGRWPSPCTMHAPLPCNCRCLISGSSRRLPSPGMRRPALNTCTRKYGRRGRTPFLHGACVRIWSLHASVHNGSMAACRFAIGWHGACPVGCTGVTGRVMGTRFAAFTL